MVQSGIAYAAGQLLAVVAPRTVLVVDAPTDWSLAGPLWELALDDAPVDEILDVLIRRGIRTAPSFAIVRVEVDAVRALVRGSVPVCFERVGEPVRLDATGATTWLEGLISGARRVLVGAVETNTKLPYLVSTGVVLVSGLALPCGPGEPENRRSSGPGVSEPASGAESSEPSADEDSFFSPPVPVSSGGSGSSGSGSTARFAPVAGREPRVVDLTRSESRPPVAPARAFTPAPEPRDSWALASNRNGSERSAGSSAPDLNGHAPTVLEPSPLDSSPAEPEPAGERDSVFSGSSAVEAPSSLEPPSSYRAPAAFQAPAPSAFQVPSPFAPSERVSDDPGELHDLDDPLEDSAAPAEEETPAAPERLDDVRSTEAEAAPEHTSDRDADVRAGTEDSLDDLLVEPAEDEDPPSPAPTDLPTFEPPAVALPLPAALNGSGSGVQAQPRGFGGAPAGWPPAPAPAGFTSDPSAPAAPRDLFAAPPFGTPPDREAWTPEAEPASEQAPPSAGELPLRVRGRSLRPEHSTPVESRLLGEPPAGPPPPVRPAAVPPLSSIPPLRSLNDPHFGRPSDRNDRLFAPITPSDQDATDQDQDHQPSDDDGTSSGGLLLPAFFRGTNAARRGPANPPPASARENARESNDEAFASPAGPPSGPIPWASGSNSAAWVPPVRRGLPDRSGFNGGPPAMPGVLRPSTPSEGNRTDQDFVEPQTEYIPPPSDTPSEGIEVEHSYEPPREPPRLLGVWCDAGHVTSPDNSECRVCGLSVPSQAPILVARPPLGVLIFDNGDRVEVDRPVVLGRDPKPVSSPDPEDPILHPVSSATGQVSRTHAEIRADGWDVVLTDLDAMNGTALTLPGTSPVAIEPGVPTVITPGARVDLGGETGFVFEVEG